MKKLLLFSALLLLFSSAGVKAQQPPVPTGLKATVEDWMGFKYVKLTWQIDTNFSERHRPRLTFLVYRKDAGLSDTADFYALPGRIKATEYFDKFVAPGKTYSYYVVSVGDSSSLGRSSDTVEVTLPEPAKKNAVITGRITDETTGNGLLGAKVDIIPLRGWDFERAVTDSMGNYFAEVTPGDYLIGFEARGYEGEFFDNVHSLRQAAAVKLAGDDTLTVSAALKAFEKPEFYTLSGFVKDTAGNPTKASIEVLVLNRRSFMRKMLHASTDSLGYYRVRVTKNDSVVVYAAPRSRTLLPEFYSDKREFAEADRILITGNMENISFVLESKPVNNNRIAGSVLAPDGKGVAASVTAFRIKEMRRGEKFRKTVLADSLGNYIMTDLAPGSYVLFAIPSEQYLPSFFRYDNIPTLKWREADTITVTAESQLAGIDFHLLASTDTGFASVNGTVKDNGGNPVNGALVYLTNQNTNVSAYATTDATGSYSITNLAPGSYTVSTDKVEYTGTSQSVTLDYQNNPSGTVALTLTENDLTPVKDKVTRSVVTDFSLSQNYPNPFNPATTIAYQIPEASFVTLKVYNLIGQQVAVLVNEFRQAGSFSARFEAANLPSGVYLYKLSAGKAVITKKMVLMK